MSGCFYSHEFAQDSCKGIYMKIGV